MTFLNQDLWRISIYNFFGIIFFIIRLLDIKNKFAWKNYFFLLNNENPNLFDDPKQWWFEIFKDTFLLAADKEEIRLKFDFKFRSQSKNQTPDQTYDIRLDPKLEQNEN